MSRLDLALIKIDAKDGMPRMNGTVLALIDELELARDVIDLFKVWQEKQAVNLASGKRYYKFLNALNRYNKEMNR